MVTEHGRTPFWARRGRGADGARLWWRALFFGRREAAARAAQRPRLLVMRLADMAFVHPDMDRTHCCSQCREPVGIYPSGQGVLRRLGEAQVDVVCSICHDWRAEPGLPAPGALDKIGQGVPR